MKSNYVIAIETELSNYGVFTCSAKNLRTAKTNASKFMNKWKAAKASIRYKGEVVCVKEFKGDWESK